MTKVAPITSTTGIADALRILIALETERKFGLKTAMTMHSRKNTPMGASARRFIEATVATVR